MIDKNTNQPIQEIDESENISTNLSDNRPFSDVLNATMPRRSVLKGSLAVAGATFLAPTPAQALIGKIGGESDEAVIGEVDFLAQYGHSPTGNDIGKIQQALDDLKIKKYGDELYFPAGDYPIGPTSDVQFLTLKDTQNFKITFHSNAKWISNGIPLKIAINLEGCDDFKIIKFQLDGSFEITGDYLYSRDEMLNKLKIAEGIRLRNCKGVEIFSPDIKNLSSDSFTEGRPVFGIRLMIPCHEVIISKGTFQNIINTGDSPVKGISIASKEGTYSDDYRALGIKIVNCEFKDIIAPKDSDGIAFIGRNTRVSNSNHQSVIVECKFENCFKRAMKIQSDYITIRDITAINIDPYDLDASSYEAEMIIGLQSVDGITMNDIDITMIDIYAAGIGLTKTGGEGTFQDINIGTDGSDIKITLVEPDSGDSSVGFRVQNSTRLAQVYVENLKIYGPFNSGVLMEADEPQEPGGIIFRNLRAGSDVYIEAPFDKRVTFTSPTTLYRVVEELPAPSGVKYYGDPVEWILRDTF